MAPVANLESCELVTPPSVKNLFKAPRRVKHDGKYKIMDEITGHPLEQAWSFRKPAENCHAGAFSSAAAANKALQAYVDEVKREPFEEAGVADLVLIKPQDLAKPKGDASSRKSKSDLKHAFLVPKDGKEAEPLKLGTTADSAIAHLENLDPVALQSLGVDPAAPRSYAVTRYTHVFPPSSEGSNPETATFLGVRVIPVKPGELISPEQFVKWTLPGVLLTDSPSHLARFVPAVAQANETARESDEKAKTEKREKRERDKAERKEKRQAKRQKKGKDPLATENLPQTQPLDEIEASQADD